MNLPVVLHFLFIGSYYIFYLRKRGFLSVGGIILTLYTISALCAFFILDDLSFTRTLELSIYPTLFFIVALVIYTRPFFYKESALSKKLSISRYNYDYLVYGYIAVAIAQTVILIPKILHMDFGDLALAYNMAWEDADAHQLYNGWFEGLLINIISYFRWPMIILFYFYLTKRDTSKLMKVSILLAIIVPNFLWALRFVSRSQLVSLFISFLFCYIIFKESINKKTRRIINIALVSFTSLLIVFFIIITLGRFSDDSSKALLYYIGHPSLVYNGSAVTPSHGNMGGQIYFDWFYEKFGLKTLGEADDVIGTTADSAFKTFLGTRYIDFGPIGTIIYGCILCIIILSLLKRKRIGIAELYIYLFYAEWIFIGAFYDSLKAMNWLMAIIIILFLKSPLFIRKKNGSNCILPAPISSHPS